MNDKILLQDLLNLSIEELNNCKIRLMKSNGYVDPLTHFLKEPEEINTNWLFWNYTNASFRVGQYVIALLKMDYDTYLLTTIKKITKDYNIRKNVGYAGIELEKYKKYYGRIIIKYHNTSQNLIRNANSIINELEVIQILNTTYDGVKFPGYDNVCLHFKDLETIIIRQKDDWISALKNQKAVYLITDLCEGKQYVGSATGENGMLLQRWSNYIENGHGGNKKLKEIVEQKGFDYIKQNFQYSILENYNARTDKNLILNRESYWKRVLGTRAFGLNSN
mgnify:FL=1